MPNNFLGLPFAPFVRKQINTRQNALGKYDNIPSKDLQYYNSKTPFLRLASSVNVTNEGPDNTELENSVLKKLINLGYDPEIITGKALATNCILQGGVVNTVDTDENGEFSTNASFSGLKSGLNNGSTLSGAYGWGGISERGFVPMPGIINANVQYYNNGALNKAVVNFKCFSKSQFQLIDVLYLRPGYTVLLEFGWSQYLDNDGNLQSFSEFYTPPLSKLLNGQSDQFEMNQLISSTKKQHSGNYDAVYGKISNFNWKFNIDGSYDCSCIITGMGDLIESLKVNITNPSKVKLTDNSPNATGSADNPPEPPIIANADATVINQELFKIYQSSTGTLTISTSDYTIPSFKNEEGIIGDITYAGSKLVVPGTTCDIEQNQSPQVFLKYGAFLAYLQNTVLIYDADKPLVTFDMDFQNINNDENVILRVPGQFSSDPRVCLIPYTNTNLGDAGDTGLNMPDCLLNQELKKSNYFFEGEGSFTGRLSNIFININFLAEALANSPKNEDNSISLLSYLKTINQSIIQSLGGINEFEVKLNDDNTKIRFIEDIPQRFIGEQESEDEYTRFNVFGVKPGINGSFVKNIDLQADISPELSSMIVIGSQTNSNQISANATTFGNYSAGLIDRIIPEKKSFSPDPNDPSNDSSVDKTIKSNWDNNINNVQNGLFNTTYGGLKWVSANLSSLNQHNSTHASLILGVLTTPSPEEKAQLAAPFFLPFKLNLEIYGLSGMKLYEKFLISQDILPPSYEREAVDLQIRGLNHDINPTTWTTQIEAFSVPSNKDLGAPKRPAQLKSVITTQQSGGGSGPLPSPSIVEPPPSLNPESLTRFNAMQASYNAVFARDGAVSGMCAQWTYNLAVNYIEYLEGRSISGPKLKAGGNANNNNEYYNNLTKLGYTKTISRGLTKDQLQNSINNPSSPWGYGDVVAYYANDKPASGAITHWQYGHTQIYVGTINSSKWSTSTATNYGTSFVYAGRNSNNWDLLVFRAPSDSEPTTTTSSTTTSSTTTTTGNFDQQNVTNEYIEDYFTGAAITASTLQVGDEFYYQIEYNNNGTTVYGQGFGTVGDQGALSTARNIAIASAKLKAKGEIINNL